MSSPADSLKTWILEAIDQLRQRKARPDTARICHMVRRRYGASNLEILAELERLVNDETVIKVDYKGKTSYRNAARWVLNRHHLGSILNSEDVSRTLIRAIKDATAAKPSGVTIKEIEQELIKKDANTKLKNEALTVAMEREVNSGAVKFAASGVYILHSPTVISQTTLEAPTRQNFASNQQIVVPLTIPSVIKPTTSLSNQDIPVTKKSPSATKSPSVTKQTASPTPKQVAAATAKQAASISTKQTPTVTRQVSTIAKQLSAATKQPTTGTKRPLTPTKQSPAATKQPSSSTKQGAATSPKQTASSKPTMSASKQQSNGNATYNLKKRGRPNKAESPTPIKTRNSSAKTTRGRPISKRKRIKKTHGPDFVETSSIPSLDSDIEDLDEVCDLCFLGASCNPRGLPEKLMSCRGCNNKAHLSCVKNCIPGLQISGSTWYCLDCKNTEDQKAEEEAAEKNTEEDTSKTSSPYTTPLDSPVSEAPSQSPAEEVPMDLEGVIRDYPSVVPNAQEWTVEDVEKFFLQVGFPKQAPYFKEQEIDGKSLLLLKRTDVLKGLNMRLGPALKIYSHVLRLQAGIPDEYLLPTWTPTLS